MHVLAASDGNAIFLGGAFTAAGGSARSRLAAVDATGGAVLPSWTTGISNNTVRALATSSGMPYVGGTFARIGGRDIRKLAALDRATGDVQLSFAPRPDGRVKALKVSANGERVYAGGLFDNIGGAPRPGVAEVRSAHGAATSFAPTQGGDGIAIALTSDGSRLFFSISNNRTFAYDPGAANTRRYIVRMGGDVRAIAATNTEVYIGGHFRNVLDPTRPAQAPSILPRGRRLDHRLDHQTPTVSWVSGPSRSPRPRSPSVATLTRFAGRTSAGSPASPALPHPGSPHCAGVERPDSTQAETSSTPDARL